MVDPAPIARRPQPAPRQLGPLQQLRAGRLVWRLPQLYAGLVLYGVTLACLIRAHLGNAPWDVLHQGIARHLGVSIGAVTIAVSLVVLLAWVPLREMPGLGTISNAVVVGLATNLGLAFLHEPHALAGRIALMALGIAGNAAATAMYIGARFGPGSRDGLMTGLHRRTRRPIWVVRTSIEVGVVAAGWLLGGVFGAGTVLYALAIGPLVQRMLPLFTVRVGDDSRHRVIRDDSPSRSADLADRGEGRLPGLRRGAGQLVTLRDGAHGGRVRLRELFPPPAKKPASLTRTSPAGPPGPAGSLRPCTGCGSTRRGLPGLPGGGRSRRWRPWPR